MIVGADAYANLSKRGVDDMRTGTTRKDIRFCFGFYYPSSDLAIGTGEDKDIEKVTSISFDQTGS